jgi:hypothetical protein
VTHRLLGVEVRAVKGRDASGLLSTVLERMEAKGDKRRSAIGAGHSEDAALLVQMVVVERISRQHGVGARVVRRPYSDCRGFVMGLGSNRCTFTFLRARRMAMAKSHGSQIKDDKLYEELRKQGESKEKAARIANARANGSLDHRSDRLEDRSKDELYEEARKIGIEGRSKMNKSALVDAVRNHK